MWTDLWDNQLHGPHNQWKMWSGIVHHKSRPQNMCLTHSWPQYLLTHPVRIENLFAEKLDLGHISISGRVITNMKYQLYVNYFCFQSVYQSRYFQCFHADLPYKDIFLSLEVSLLDTNHWWLGGWRLGQNREKKSTACQVFFFPRPRGCKKIFSIFPEPPPGSLMVRRLSNYYSNY